MTLHPFRRSSTAPGRRSSLASLRPYSSYKRSVTEGRGHWSNRCDQGPMAPSQDQHHHAQHHHAHTLFTTPPHPTSKEAPKPIARLPQIAGTQIRSTSRRLSSLLRSARVPSGRSSGVALDRGLSRVCFQQQQQAQQQEEQQQQQQAQHGTRP